MQPTTTRATFNSVDLLSIVLGRLSRLAFNERVNAADPPVRPPEKEVGCIEHIGVGLRSTGLMVTIIGVCIAEC